MTESDQSRFQFVRQLGGGVLGEVHEVVDEANGESVRLKIFRRCRPANLANFRMEFEALSRLSQPNLAKMLHLIDPASDTNIVLEEKVGTPNLAFTQELVPGLPFFEFLRKPETLEERNRLTKASTDRRDTLTPRTFELETLPPIDDSIEIALHTEEVHEIFRREHSDLVDASSIITELAQQKEAASLDVVLLRLKETIPGIVSGLEYLHRFQKPHGNLRPSNIIASETYGVKLTDYGIVASLVVNHENEGEKTPLLQAPEYVPFTAPEIRTNEASFASDLYALGCILFEAISGVSPFDALEFDLVDGKRRLQPPPLSDYVPACPSSWGELVDGLLKPNPEDRTKLADIIPLISGSETYSVHIQTDRVEKVIGFRGRKAELTSIIRDAKSATEKNQQRLTIIRGETGSGKSALLQQTAHYLSRRGWLVLKSSCFHWENELHQSWSKIAATLANVLDSFPNEMKAQFFEARAKATQILAGIRGEKNGLGAMDRNACVLALHELLKIVSKEKPILLVFDDVENASLDTSSLLIDLLCIPDTFRALVLLSWTADADDAAPRLVDDLSRTLIDYQTLELAPLENKTPPKYLSPLPMRLQRLDFPLISMWWAAFPQAIEDALKHRDIINNKTLALHTARAVYSELRTIEKLVTGLVCISSTLLPRKVIVKIVSAHAKHHDAYQIEEAIDALLDLEFIREYGEDVELAHDTIRIAMLAETEPAEISALYAKLSKAFRHKKELSIEYAHRAGDNRNAISESISEAENATRSFAFHRSAAIWKWIDLHKETMPGKQKSDYVEEWANAEFIAQEYTFAAQLFGRIIENEPHRSPILTKICQSFLWSNNLAEALQTLEKAIEQNGGKLHKKSPIVFFAKEKSIEEISSKAPASELAKNYHFATKYASFLSGTSAAGTAIRLASLTKTEGRETWCYALSAKMRVSYSSKLATPPELFLSWARKYISAEPKDENIFFLQKIQLRFGKQEHDFLKLVFDKMDPRAPITTLVDALDFCLESLAFGGRERATKFALDVIRANHRNRFVSTIAYQILIQDAIYRNDVEGALLYFEFNGFQADFNRMSEFEVVNFICEADVSILQGECEVSVARYKLLSESPAFSHFCPRTKANLSLGLFRALTAQYRRDRALGSKRVGDTLKSIAKICNQFKKTSGCSDPYLSAASLRALALSARLHGKNKKAERLVRHSIEILDGRFSPLINAVSLEALAITSNEEDRRGMFESAVLLQSYFGYSQLLQQEGWPAFEDIPKK